MQIIVGQEAADKLRDKYTVLELETLNGQTAYCVVSADKINLQDLVSLAQYIELHQNLITEMNKGDSKFVLDAIEHLYDKFGGELNSFYDHLKQKYANN
jgi:hypothetical protein